MNKLLIAKSESSLTDSEVKEWRARKHARAHTHTYTHTKYSDSISIISLFKLPKI